MTTYHSVAFVYQGKPGAVTRETLTLRPGPRDLLVKVTMCARCGTDKTIYRSGHPNVDPYAPVVLGHELVAQVVEVGAEVGDLTEGIGYCQGQTLPSSALDFAPGERVTFQSRIARYRDGLMLVPRPIANLSFQINGGFAQYMIVPESMIRSGSVLRVADAISDEEACLVEPAACALESIYATPHPVGADKEGRHIMRAGIRPGGNTCIIGSGTVSMIYARLAFLEGAGKVVVIVRSAEKARLVREKLGSEVIIYEAPRTPEDASSATRAAEDVIVDDMDRLTDSYLFDDVVSANASATSQRLLLRLYTPEGYAVGACFGGTHNLVDAANIDSNHYRAAKTIGTSGCSTNSMKTVLAWLSGGRLSLRGMISPRHYTLADDPHEFFTVESGLKPALYMEETG
ncbi:MAG TPA: alcohol dehydrogenase catalytic domain-containing protein [Spirochaetia bacterium]|nr:alcohol dehydrogenase catalytic domain-containing protein [Spirochaetia bacterium]